MTWQKREFSELTNTSHPCSVYSFLTDLLHFYGAPSTRREELQPITSFKNKVFDFDKREDFIYTYILRRSPLFPLYKVEKSAEVITYVSATYRDSLFAYKS